MWIENVPTAPSEPRTFWIIRSDIHCQLETRFRDPLWQIEIWLKRKFLGKIGKCAVNLHGATPIPLTDRPKPRYRRTPPATKKLGIGQWIKCLPPKRRDRKSTRLNSSHLTQSRMP